MADTTPRLPVTAEANDYAPYSFLAVFSAGLAGLFVLVLLLLGISSWLAGQPLFEPELLIIPLVALVLSFAARRQIRNSEGTRVGLPLCNAAWWIAIVGGLCFMVYLFGIGFAVSRDAETAFKLWADPFAKINPVDPKNVEMLTTFHGTLTADKQVTVAPTDSVKLHEQFRNPLLAYRQSDLVRIAARNPGEVQFEVIGLEDWKNEKSGVLTCRLTVKVTSPEGEFTMGLPMARQTLKGKTEPIWQIQPPQNDSTLFFRTTKLNDYGERIRDMEIAAHQLALSFLTAVNSRDYNAKIFEEYGKPTPEAQMPLIRLNSQANLRGALLGGIAYPNYDPVDEFESISQQHFKPLDGGDPARESEQRKQFRRVWQGGFIGLPGHILTRSPDVAPIFVPGPDAWEVRVPIELQTTQGDSSQSAARGVVVLRVDDPEFLAELKALRANPGQLHDPRTRTTPPKPVPWRVVRIESDMKVETAARLPQ